MSVGRLQPRARTCVDRIVELKAEAAQGGARLRTLRLDRVEFTRLVDELPASALVIPFAVDGVRIVRRRFSTCG